MAPATPSSAPGPAATALRIPEFGVPIAPAARAPQFISPAAVIMTCSLALTFLGLTILFSASANKGSNPYDYLVKQVIGVFLAAGLCFAVSRINLEFVRRYTWWIAGAAVLALALTAIPGIGISVNGSRRWLGLAHGPRFQPSEFGKIALVFALAHYLALNQSRISELKRGYLVPIGIIATFCLLVVVETDLGTTALMGAVGVLLLFLAGARWRYLVPTVVASVAGLGLAVMLVGNRLTRLLAFLDVEGNRNLPNGTYQLWQGMLAFAAGGTRGAGLGQGRQQINFLPEAHTDFIFAVVGEELGLWFTLGVLALFLTIFVAGLVHIRRAPNLFGFLLATGTLLLICLQAIINLGVVTGVFPTKGMSLPFMSAGLSNLLLMGILLGVLLNTQRTWGRAAMPGKVRSLKEVFA